MKIESHVLDSNGKCARCGMTLAGLPMQADRPTPQLGDRIGVISGLTSSPDSGYLIQSRYDSNNMCEMRMESIP